MKYLRIRWLGKKAPDSSKKTERFLEEARQSIARGTASLESASAEAAYRSIITSARRKERRSRVHFNSQRAPFRLMVGIHQARILTAMAVLVVVCALVFLFAPTGTALPVALQRSPFASIDEAVRFSSSVGIGESSYVFEFTLAQWY